MRGVCKQYAICIPQAGLRQGSAISKVSGMYTNSMKTVCISYGAYTKIIHGIYICCSPKPTTQNLKLITYY